jgi:hypothetical protein
VERWNKGRLSKDRNAKCINQGWASDTSGETAKIAKSAISLGIKSTSIGLMMICSIYPMFRTMYTVTSLTAIYSIFNIHCSVM